MTAISGARPVRPGPGTDDDGPGRRGELGVLARLIGPHRREAVLGLGASALSALAFLVPGYLTKVLIDEGIKGDSEATIVWVSVASAVLVVATGFLRVVRFRYNSLLANEVVVSLQRRLFAHVVALPPAYHADHTAGTTLSRLTNDAMVTRRLFSQGLPTLIQTAVNMVGSLIIMLILDWDMALAALAVVPVLVVISRVYQRVVAPRYRRFRDAVATVTEQASHTLGVVELIQSYNQQARHEAAFSTATLQSRDAEYGTITANAVYYPVTSLLSATAKGVLIMYGGLQVVRGESEVGTMVALFTYVQIFLSPIANLSQIFQTYQAGMAAVDKISRMLEIPVDGPGDGDHRPAEGHGDPVAESVAISLDRVSLVRDGRPAIRDLSLTIPAGSTVAIVGEAGSGRADVGQLLGGLALPDEGTVRVDGADIHAGPAAALYRRLAYVSAETGLFDITVRENLRLARPEASDGDLVAALDALLGPQFLAALPRGLDTAVGQDGRRLPTGRRNGLLIARALLRAPAAAILDQVTDALDVATLRHLAEQRVTTFGRATLVAVTRQPLIADYADQVIVLADGSIEEQGAPGELMARGGAYAELRTRWRAGLSGT